MPEKASIVNLENLFAGPVSYRIPQFQRPYAWKRDTQWKPLLDDVIRCADQTLNGEEPLPHFMGAIVLQPQSNATGEVQKRIVVDGQQRLTTLQLLLKAAEQVFVNRNDTARADRFANLTKNDDAHLANDNDNHPKIRQSSILDQVAFQEVVRNAHSIRISPIVEAFNFFKEGVANWLDTGSQSRADALETAITRQLQMAAIDLAEREEPHLIFEILNERGERLTQSDLIKNTIMYRANVVDDAGKARQLWGLFNDEFWRDSTSEGKLSRIHNDRFLNYWVAMKKPEQVSSEEVAVKFRALLRNELNGVTIEAVAEQIRESAVFYRDMEEGKVTDMELFLSRLKVLGFGVVTPVLMWLKAAGVPSEKRIKAHTALESYLVRRTLLKLNSNGLNRFFEELLRDLAEKPATMADAVVVEKLSSQPHLDNRLWPTDQVLKEVLIGRPMPVNQARRKMLLEAIERSLRTDKTEPLGDTSKLTLEHIMPQKGGANWPLSDDSDDKQQEREAAIEELGNLTLITQKLNAAVSNGPWEKKRPAIEGNATLLLSKTVLDLAPPGTQWDEALIRERSRLLVDEIIKIWPHADSI